MKKITNLFVALMFFMASSAIFAQGVTTSSMNGQILDSNGDALPGASVTAVHVPSGTKYGSATDFDGFYRISGMRSGGPYTITITYVGYQDYLKEEVYLNLGQTVRLSAKLTETANALE